MVIFVDEQEQTQEALGTCENFGELFQVLETGLLQEQRRLINNMELVNSSGGPVEAEPDEIARMSLQQFDQIRFTTVSLKEYAKSEVFMTQHYLKAAVEGFERVSELLTTKEFAEGLGLFGELINGLQMFMTQLQNLREVFGLDFNTITDGNGKTIQQQIEDLNQILADMLDGMENKDYVLVNDYLTYELLPHLKGWQGRLDNIVEAIP